MSKDNRRESDYAGHLWVEEQWAARPVQYFSKEYLEQCKRMKPEDILRFLDAFRRLYSPAAHKKSRAISVRVPENLLDAFKAKARLHEVPYQNQIKKLMMEWVTGQPEGTNAEERETSRGHDAVTKT